MSSLDVSITKLNDKIIETTVFRKENNTNMYINWNPHAPVQWKIGTLKNLIQRSILICSNEILLEKEINRLRTVFTKINDYSTRVVNNVTNDDLQKLNIGNNKTNNNKTVTN